MSRSAIAASSGALADAVVATHSTISTRPPAPQATSAAPSRIRCGARVSRTLSFQAAGSPLGRVHHDERREHAPARRRVADGPRNLLRERESRRRRGRSALMSSASFDERALGQRADRAVHLPGGSRQVEPLGRGPGRAVRPGPGRIASNRWQRGSRPRGVPPRDRGAHRASPRRPWPQLLGILDVVGRGGPPSAGSGSTRRARRSSAHELRGGVSRLTRGGRVVVGRTGRPRRRRSTALAGGRPKAGRAASGRLASSRYSGRRLRLGRNGGSAYSGSAYWGLRVLGAPRTRGLRVLGPPCRRAPGYAAYGVVVVVDGGGDTAEGRPPPRSTPRRRGRGSYEVA